MLKRKVHRIILLLLDALFVSVALGLAYLIRRDFNIELEYRLQYVAILPFVLIVRIFLFFLFKLYKGMLRYASINELVAIVASSSIGTLIFIILNIFLENFHRLGPLPLHPGGQNVLRVPWGVIVIEWLLVILLIGGERFSRRIILTFGFRLPKDARRVLIVGAGDLGDAVARQLMKDPMRGYKPVCFVDDDPITQGKYIHRLPVVGSLKDLPDAIERYRIDDAILAMEDISPLKLRQVISDCKTTLVTFRIAPNVHDLIEGKIEVSQIRRVEIEDLLGREPVRLILPEEKNYIRGERVLVTGAGGSIGSELCRQLATYEPECILFLGRGENSIYEIAAEFDYRFKGNRIIPIIADITDEIRLREVFEEYHPTICFHAAAHKHVPLMEMYPQEAVRNNIIGTLNVARLADECGAKIFVLISTDKAVNPTNVMGATKRLAEMIIFSLAERSKTTFLAVRFGNVLGSRGSVIPLFKKQIERGGPVTVTHPNVMR
ncbi:MAG: nucleoside-diphosphate sugar epimerase/dehydratase, partial [Candidatus Sumerlaeota bacterium]|nr:nucleoside-diphosphate sugar epimerase/dehydratase [Candidatus Sumerlaeota bacterium]